MIKKIISGGQTGAERAALDVAIKLGIAHGGWVPKGRIFGGRFLPRKYNLQEMPSTSLAKAVEQNVMDSDGTLVVSNGFINKGVAYCRKTAKKHNRPCVFIDLDKVSFTLAIAYIYYWVLRQNIEVLNITGPSAVKEPKIYSIVFMILEGVYRKDTMGVQISDQF